MKNQMNGKKGITLIALVITIVVLLILAGVTIATLTGDNGLLQKTATAKQENEKAKELELIKLAVSAAKIAGDGTITVDNLNNELQNNFKDDNEVSIYDDYYIYTTDRSYRIYEDGTTLNLTNELYFTKTFLQNGEVNEVNGSSINYMDFIINGNKYPGMSITGRPNKIGWYVTPEEEIRWYKNINLTNYNTLEFLVKKGSTHGSMKIRIDNNDILVVRYADLSEEWTKYTVDLTQYNETHTLNFVGGYFDITGQPSANTQYCNIVLKY